MDDKNNSQCDKLIIAILQNDDYHDVIETLNQHNFYVTVLRSSGGFLKKASATIMIGLNHERLDEALELLKQYGRRTEMAYQPAASTAGMVMPPLGLNTVTVPVHCGGVVLFVVDVAKFEKY